MQANIIFKNIYKIKVIIGEFFLENTIQFCLFRIFL